MTAVVNLNPSRAFGPRPAPGRYPGVPEAAYFAADALNASTLKPIGRSPAHCLAAMEAAASPDTEAQLVGRLVHCALLEPVRFAADYCPAPAPADFPEALTDLASYKAAARAAGLPVSGTKADLRERLEGAGAKVAFWEDVAAEATANRTALRPEHWALAQAVLGAVAANPRARAALSGGAAEETLVWHDGATGLRCKARLDYYREDLGVVFDVKTCDDARPERVERDILKWGYHLSAAHYLAGLRQLGLPGDNFAWIFAEKKPPHAIGLYMASPALLAQAGRDWAELMARFARCRASNDWPGYPAEFLSINLPAWARDL